MIGLARMAANLADARTARYRRRRHWGGIDFARGYRPARRDTAQDARKYPASAEYYAIIDRITRGEKP